MVAAPSKWQEQDFCDPVSKSHLQVLYDMTASCNTRVHVTLKTATLIITNRGKIRVMLQMLQAACTSWDCRTLSEMFTFQFRLAEIKLFIVYISAQIQVLQCRNLLL